MTILISILDERGLVGATLKGVTCRIAHTIAFDKVRGLVERGELVALIVDGRETEAPRERSFTREMWSEAMSLLDGRPVAYIPPPDFTPDREAMVRTAAAEWGSLVTFPDAYEDALAWGRAQLPLRIGA